MKDARTRSSNVTTRATVLWTMLLCGVLADAWNLVQPALNGRVETRGEVSLSRHTPPSALR